MRVASFVSRSVLDIDALVQRVGPLDGQEARASVAGGAGYMHLEPGFDAFNLPTTSSSRR